VLVAARVVTVETDQSTSVTEPDLSLAVLLVKLSTLTVEQLHGLAPAKFACMEVSLEIPNLQPFDGHV
jgi:hypothetical protein